MSLKTISKMPFGEKGTLNQKPMLEMVSNEQ
jgi:hypothetical protein